MDFTKTVSTVLTAMALQMGTSVEGIAEPTEGRVDYTYIGAVPSLVWSETPSQLDFMQSILVLVDQYEDHERLTNGPWVSSIFISAQDAIVNYHFNVSYLSALDDLQKDVVGRSKSQSNECFVQQYENDTDGSFCVGATTASENSELAKKCFLLTLGMSSEKISTADTGLSSKEILTLLIK